ncbi:MAG TPA: lysyl oxidase family protein [Nocardioides sp.]|nr:lysyl oxidase family protein [Nocardioides sp.]
MPRHSLRTAARAVGLVFALALPVALPPVSAGAQGPTAAVSASPLTLWSPDRIVTYAYGGRVWTDLGLRVIAQSQPFEIWSTRTSYADPVRAVWRSPSGDVALPGWATRDFSGLRAFIKLSLTRMDSGQVTLLSRKACFSGWAERVRPDAPPRSPYPRNGCWSNPYSLGSVQGVEAGWAAPVLSQERPMRLRPGRYRVTAAIAPAYAQALGISAADATRSLVLVVKRQQVVFPEPAPSPGIARPAAQEPSGTGSRRAPVSGPVPDLRSLPAWGIKMAGNGNYLQFSATVWNAGDSPLVVDGFRREGEDTMDAYQYFFDAAGNQTGYQLVGEMHWDAKPTHQHWHFEDFARYALLDAGQAEAVRSHKEAFCLANTDAVDLTVPNAAWNPENTDLNTSCGDLGSLSIREVLASGWGDTYAQFRAGQSFDLRGLPNGTYYVAVIANPANRLVESSTDNNMSLRQVVIRGTENNRTVTVPQVGLVVEPAFLGR